MGNALATAMSRRGEHNVGQLCRSKLGRDAYIVGFGTDHGTVAAASGWDVKRAVRDELEQPPLERAIGVIYRPDTELASH